MNGMKPEDINDWTSTAVRLWGTPVDNSTKISAVTTVRSFGELVYNIPMTIEYGAMLVKFMKTTL